MSWSTELTIGDLRPWPDSVHVVRGRTEETRRYVPERTCHKIITGRAFPHCSNCGSTMGNAAAYCQTCGAKVVVQ